MIQQISQILHCRSTESHIKAHLLNRHNLVLKIIKMQAEPFPTARVFATCQDSVVIQESKLGSVRTSMDTDDLDILKLAPRISCELERIFAEIVRRRQQVVVEFEKARLSPRMMDQRKSYREVIKYFYNWYKQLIETSFRTVFGEPDELLRQFRTREMPNFSVEEVDAMSQMMSLQSSQHFMNEDGKPSKECVISDARYKQLQKRIEDERNFYLYHLQIMWLFHGKREPTQQELQQRVIELQRSIEGRTKTKSSKNMLCKRLSRYLN